MATACSLTIALALLTAMAERPPSTPATAIASTRIETITSIRVKPPCAPERSGPSRSRDEATRGIHGDRERTDGEARNRRAHDTTCGAEDDRSPREDIRVGRRRAAERAPIAAHDRLGVRTRRGTRVARR